MPQPEICVLITIFNQKLSSIEKSINSVSKQKNIYYELLLSDDHSSNDITSELDELCKKYEIKEHQIIRHNKNLQTIGNILNSLDYVNSKYVKVLGSGDELYSNTTLSEIVHFCQENNVKAGFGQIIKDSDNLIFNAPKNHALYPPNGSKDNSLLFKDQLANADWIPGCCQFFETLTLKKLLSELYDNMGLRYCEDFAELIALESMDVYCMNSPVILYEWGGGISTNGSLESRKKLYKDHENLYEWIAKEKPFGRSYNLDLIKFRIREFIALHTPLYSFFQKKVADSYSVEKEL